MSFKIESNIPVPERRNAGASYPFGDMKAGQSFLVEAKNGDADKARNRLYAATLAFRNKHEKAAKFVVRPVEGGVRVWRA